MFATVQVRAHLVELLRLPGAASPPRHIVIHRDGPAWQSEQIGARQAVIQLCGERVLDPDATPPILEVSKSAPAPLRLFEVTGSETRPWVENPQVGAQSIAGNDAYPLLPPVVTALAVALPHLPGLQPALCPLAEGRILLHLPDLYHEIAHTLLSEQNNPAVEAFQAAMYRALDAALLYVDGEASAV